MQVIAGGGERGPIVSSAVVASALVLLAFTVLSGFAVYPVAALLAAVATGVVAYRTLLQWRMLIAAMLVVIAALAVVERRTGFNPFNHLSGFIPGLQFRGAFGTDSLLRAGRLRVYGPAEHPIALGAALVMLIPLAVYLAHSSGKRRWWGA